MAMQSDEASWTGMSASAEELRLVAALRAGDEAAFATLIDRYHASLLRLAMLYVPSRAVAEEVAQETWLGVLQGIGRFEGRSSLKTWIFRILTNRARTRGQREGRSVPFSALAGAAAEPGEPAVDPDRFLPPEHEDAGWWVSYPQSWHDRPEERLLSQETQSVLRQAIDALPPSQREVITLRDLEGWASDEVCGALSVSEANQRVLLHRARSKVRRALEQYFDGV
ncbi:MAG TPA: sigma-70 family RNA polymerase sigma factor [Roseiflexaceae bacterium]